MATGRLAHGQVQAILANLRNQTIELFAEHEADLIPTFEALTVRETGIAMMHWTANANAIIDVPEPVEPEQHFRINATLDGRWQLAGTLNTELGSMVERALRLARPDNPTLNNGAANAEALDAIKPQP